MICGRAQGCGGEHAGCRPLLILPGLLFGRLLRLGAAAVVGSECIERVAAVIGYRAVHARLSVPDPVLLDERDRSGSFVRFLAQNVVPAAALALFGSRVADIAGLGIACPLKIIGIVVRDPDVMSDSLKLQAVNLAIIPLHIVEAVGRSGRQIVNGLHTVQGICRKAIAGNLHIIRMQALIARQCRCCKAPRAERRRQKRTEPSLH